jgi:hypothetical protein
LNSSISSLSSESEQQQNEPQSTESDFQKSEQKEVVSSSKTKTSGDEMISTQTTNELSSQKITSIAEIKSPPPSDRKKRLSVLFPFFDSQNTQFDNFLKN